jgi:hypothetical protein
MHAFFSVGPRGRRSSFPLAAALLAVSASSALAIGTSVDHEVNPDMIVFHFDAPGAINFEAEPVGAKPNGYTPTPTIGAPIMHFSDSNGADIQVFNWGTQSNGIGLAVFNDFDNSHVVMNFDTPVSRLFMRFGNDDPGFSNPGDQAVLRGFNAAGTQVAVVGVVMNRNDVMDQGIEILATNCDVANAIKSATFKYEINPAQGLIEIIDDITYETCAAGPPPPGPCDLSPIEAKLDDETRFTDDGELADSDAAAEARFDAIDAQLQALETKLDALSNSDLEAMLCEIIRLLHTPNGLRESDACGVHYEWNRTDTGAP